MKYDFSMKPIEVKTEEQVEVLATALSNPKVIKLDKTPEEQESLDKIVNTIKGMSNIDEKTVNIICKAVQKNAIYLQDESFYENERNTYMTKQEKLEQKEYLKDVKQARKHLIKASKNYFPFDFEYTLDLFMIGIQHMREYYARGYNVVAKEIEGMPTRLDMCNEILTAYDDYLDCVAWGGEEEAWNNLCDIVKKYLLYLWD